jgi:hypothetical protein
VKSPHRTYGCGPGYDIWGDSSNVYVCGGFYSHQITKWDLDGNFIWKTNASCDTAFDILELGSSLFTCSYDGKLIKWDVDGNQIWNVTINSENVHFLSLETDGTNLYTGGVQILSSESSLQKKAILVKWNQDGNKIWERIFTDNGNTSLNSLTYSDGYIYGSGYSGYPDSATGYNIFLQKWDLEGNVNWTKEWTQLSNATEFTSGIWANSTHVLTTAIARKSSVYDDMVVHLWDSEGKTVFEPQPEAPELLELIYKKKSVSLSWTSVPRAILYNVYISDTNSSYQPDWVLLTSTNETNFITYQEPNNNYYWRVTAMNYHGESNPSNILQIKPPNISGFQVLFLILASSLSIGIISIGILVRRVKQTST